MKIAIIGQRAGTHVGGSLERSALRAGHEVEFFDTTAAFAGNRILRAVSWRLSHRPPRLAQFAAACVAGVRRFRAEVVIATGLAPLDARSLVTMRIGGARCINYLTDDPWNRAFRARWLMAALPEYDTIYSTRLANLDDLRRRGCAQVRYLPFGYDPELFHPAPPAAEGFDVVFAGGADADRVPIVRALVARYNVGLFGGAWGRYADLRGRWRGLLTPPELCSILAASAVALCIVRRANRDGHAMRSFETPAAGACMVAERTIEHERILGPDGECVLYFSNQDELIARIDRLLADPVERKRLAAAAYSRVTQGGNTYDDRLRALLGA